MKYLKKFNEEILFFDKIKKYKIDKICEKYGIENYTINSDGSLLILMIIFIYMKNN